MRLCSCHIVDKRCIWFVCFDHRQDGRGCANYIKHISQLSKSKDTVSDSLQPSPERPLRKNYATVQNLDLRLYCHNMNTFSLPDPNPTNISHCLSRSHSLPLLSIYGSDIQERHLLRLGAGSSDIYAHSQKDFSKWGRVNSTLARRMHLLGEVCSAQQSIACVVLIRALNRTVSQRPNKPAYVCLARWSAWPRP